jgi:hypothetical protein
MAVAPAVSSAQPTGPNRRERHGSQVHVRAKPLAANASTRAARGVNVG